jgi:hypothetical protein
MVIVGLALLIVLLVVAAHSYTRKDAPREPFYIDLEEVDSEN